MTISRNEFMTYLPTGCEDSPEINYYFNLSNELLLLWNRSGFMLGITEETKKRTILAITGYFMDICSDIGLWRSFISGCKKLYDKILPFYDIPEDYIEAELNPEDIRFICWMTIVLSEYGNKEILYPLDRELNDLADSIHFRLDECYESAPDLHDIFNTRQLEIHNEDEAQEIMRLGGWVYWNSYLMKPVLEYNTNDILNGIDRKDKDAVIHALSAAQMEYPCGPLALFLREWIYLLLENKFPEEGQPQSVSEEKHPLYTKFMAANGGERIRFFGNYDTLNKFFIEGLGWESGVEHLPNLKSGKNFILMVSPYKGMLVAKDVAQCIKSPLNPFYDEEYAKRNAFRMLSQKGYCPADLTRYSCANGWLPDAVFPGTDDTDIVKNNWDFIARCFLQLYYRD